MVVETSTGSWTRNIIVIICCIQRMVKKIRPKQNLLTKPYQEQPSTAQNYRNKSDHSNQPKSIDEVLMIQEKV